MNTFVAVVFSALLAPLMASAQPVLDAKAEVLKAEAAFSDAKIRNDVAALDRILADEYIGLNQWGARRDKTAVLELFKTFSITSLVPSAVRVRVAGDTAVVDGIMNESGDMKFMFMRTYVKRQGRWLLLTSSQLFAINPETMKPLDPSLLGQ